MQLIYVFLFSPIFNFTTGFSSFSSSQFSITITPFSRPHTHSHRLHKTARVLFNTLHFWSYGAAMIIASIILICSCFILSFPFHFFVLFHQLLFFSSVMCNAWCKSATKSSLLLLLLSLGRENGLRNRWIERTEHKKKHDEARKCKEKTTKQAPSSGSRWNCSWMDQSRSKLEKMIQIQLEPA